MDIPSVYAFQDVRAYLRAWWEAEHARNPSFSKSEMSRRLGLPNTRSYFTDVLAGKPITELFVARFTEVLGLSVEEGRFFKALVDFHQAAVPEDREIALDALITLNRSPFRKVGLREYQYYKHWYHGAIRAVLDIEDHADDWALLASRVLPPITQRQAREAVELMAELGFVARDDRGFWKPMDLALSTGDDVHDELVLQLQIQQFDLARKAIMTSFTTPKEIATSTLSLSKGALERVRDRFQRFRAEVRSIATQDPDPADRVYSLCTALFPLTKSE